MAEDLIRYDILAQDALRGVVRKVLGEVAKTGLPGEHHFYVTFVTKAPGVRISSRLLNQYPGDMTIVLQHQYWDLSVSEHAFEVGLSFSGIPERLLIPFSAVKAFIDPSVQFALQFEPALTAATPEAAAETPVAPAEVKSFPAAAPNQAKPATPAAKAAEPAPAAEPDKPEPPKDGAPAQVVSLDAFRKKN